MPLYLDQFQTPKRAERHKFFIKALASLEVCGCLALWRTYTQLTVDGEQQDNDLYRLQRCLQEQCWDADVIDLELLTDADRHSAFPVVVKQTLKDKLKVIRENRRSSKSEAFRACKALQEKHKHCQQSSHRCTKVALEVTEFIRKSNSEIRMQRINEDIERMISNSNWSKFVDASRVCNLTSNQVNNTELELLSLGLDFKMQGTNSSILGVFEGFERFKERYDHRADMPNLRTCKKNTLMDLHSKRVDSLPVRYLKAIKSLKSNKDVKIVQSDKGKVVVVCYTSTYDALVTAHFSDVTHYEPVHDDDISGRDLASMTRDFQEKIKKLISESNDHHARKILKDLLPPDSSRFPKGRVNLKVHKEGVTETHIPVRPIVSNSSSPTSNLASYLGKNLTSKLGLVSSKHIGSTEQFARAIQSSTPKGRLLSLDVVNLFTCIPVNKAIEFLRNCSNGWGPSPPSHANPVVPPIYCFDMDSKLFCDLVELCLAFNQFEVDGQYFRQVSGLFMGSSLSPAIAQAYMEHFETDKYEKFIPDNLKATVWSRYVDDCFIDYEHGDEDFDRFFNKLNQLDPYIKFTCEKSKPGRDYGLGSESVEALPFLDLLVVKFLNIQTGDLTYELDIYRKPCHSSAYIHSQSKQPLSTKRAVVRSMFLRALRYCSSVFMDREISRIYADFTRLGYNKRFIDKAHRSAKQGRANEIRIRNGEAEPRSRQRQDFILAVPFHETTKGLRRLGHERGIDVVFTSSDSIGRRLHRSEKIKSDAGIYIIPCDEASCERVYVGQSKAIPRRMVDHERATRGVPSLSHYASARHKHPSSGKGLNPNKSVVPFRSTSLHRRLMIETALMEVSNTVEDNKASKYLSDMDIIAPILLRAVNIDWQALARIQPGVNPSVVPRKYRRFFREIPHVPSPSETNAQISGVNPVSNVVTPRYNLRSRSGRIEDR